MSAVEEVNTTSNSQRPASQTIAVSGASGLVGTALSDCLRADGHKVLALSRSDSDTKDGSIHWTTESGIVNPDRLGDVDTIVHLAGENIAGGRWTAAMKDRIRSSRVDGTRNLVNSIGAVEKRPSTLICASAIGFYGDRGSAELDESSAAGSGFLPDTCRDWETEALLARDLGMRVVCLRIAMVLSPKGGALAKMLLPFKLGAGGVVGSGKQYWSWIGLTDLVRIISHCVSDSTLSGPVNAASPNPDTNRVFTKTLGKVLKRPTLIPMPGFLAKIALGQMADDLLLASARVLPKKLEDTGFEFQHPELEDCLRHELNS